MFRQKWAMAYDLITSAPEDVGVCTERLARIMVDADIEALKHEGKPWIDQPDLEGWPQLKLPRS